jgi:hypothetical protein
VSGDTLVSGVPRAPHSGTPRFPPAHGGPGRDHGPRGAVASGPSVPEDAGRGGRKGRSGLVLAGGGLVALLAVAYGAGLLLDHADVPKGTTVLGVDIGGTSKETAVQKLDTALSDRNEEDLSVTVDGTQHAIRPDAAGLAIDTRTTVGNAAGRDYNPVSVIGSLFGGTRETKPVIVVDEEKLRAALRTLDGEATGDLDGTILFQSGKAVAAPGRTHKALDVDKAATAVGTAYRQRALTGRAASVALPVGMQEPAIDTGEIDRAMKEFARPAMSGLVTVRTDAAHTISFSPQNSLPKFLAMKAVNGKLVDTYDLKVLQSLYGGTFDGVLIQRGNGQKTPVTPQDVAGALHQALRGNTPAERIGTIETDPQ